MPSILFFAKQGHPFAIEADRFLKARCELETVWAGRGAAVPESFGRGAYDYVVSFLCPWILPPRVLNLAGTAAVNLHPAPPEYPGTGCTNFALYHEAEEYGVTCHHMRPGVDSGAIIAVRRFPVHPQDDVWSLTQRSYAYLAQLAYEMFDLILAGGALPSTTEQWARTPYTRAQLEDLCDLTPDMDPDEMRRRIRATRYPGYPSPRMVAGGRRFVIEGWEQDG